MGQSGHLGQEGHSGKVILTSSQIQSGHLGQVTLWRGGQVKFSKGNGGNGDHEDKGTGEGKGVKSDLINQTNIIMTYH